MGGKSIIVLSHNYSYYGIITFKTGSGLQSIPIENTLWDICYVVHPCESPFCSKELKRTLPNVVVVVV